MLADLKAATEPGKRLVALAETHAEEFAATAADRDRDAQFPIEHVDAMKASGAIAATVPEELGGMGNQSIHDLAVALSRMGRGDGSLTIGMAMHFLGTWLMARRWYQQRARWESTTDANLLAVVEGRLVMAVLNSEPGSDNRHPFTEATPTEGGYLLNGRKGFGTLSPAATLFSVRVRLPDEGEGFRTASATVPVDAGGVENTGNWDAMGMRASGSHDIILKDVFVPAAAVTPPVRWGQLGQPGLIGGVVAAVCLAAPFLGIAEAAHATALVMAKVREKQPGPTPLREWGPVQSAVAQNEVDLTSMRGALDRTARMIDEMFERPFPGDPDVEELYAVMKEAQAAKLIVNETAVKVVDRCLTLSGGSGYLAKSPLSRYYRDVRAGGFMSPFGALEAQEYIARVALGLPPEGPAGA